ncbi:methyltransferase domain-containing protein [Aeromonas veronii]|uniref:methyltransferase domain-containing protein n=1 Tax=Aeromonas veronii TaxID=654 RepID=UPI003DA549A7
MDKPGLRDALPQPKLSDTRTDPFWSNLDSSLSAAAAPSAAQTPQRDLNVGLGDVARGVGAGALDLVGGIGELSRQASQFGKENAGKQGGDYLEQARANMANKLSPVLDFVAGAGDLAKSGAESLTDGMSGDAKEAIGRSLIDETPEGRLTLGDGAGDIDVWAMKMAQGVGSLLPTLAAGGVTGVAAKVSIGRAVTASMVKRGATQKVAEAVAAKAVSKIAYGASVTTGVTGSVGSAGVNARDTVLGMSFDELSRSDTFRQAFTRIDQDQQTQHLSDEEKLSLAREETANVASRATMSDAKVWGAAAVGSMMGDAMLFKMLAGKAATGGVLKGAAKGAAGEWTGETLENGVQQYAINESLNKVAAADIDPMKGVVSSALEGGLIGIGTGGAVGAVGGARGGKHASQEDGVGTDPVAEPSAPVTEGAAGPAVDPNFASVPLEDGEQAPSASQAEGELNPLGPSASQFDELRDVPAYLRRDDTADRFKGMAQDSDVQRALAGEYGRSVQELVASQMQAGDQGKSLYERAQAGELGLDPFAGNKSAQQVAMENQRLALPLKDVIFAGDANAKPKGEAVAAPGDHDDQQAGPGPQFRGGERTRWQSGQEGDVLPPESAGNPAGALPGRVIDGEAREVGTELPYKPFIAGQDNRAAVSEEQRRQAEQSAMAERQQNQPKQIGQSDTIFAPGAPGADNKNSAYTPPRLSRDQVDNSLGEQSTRDPRSPVAQSIEQAGSEQDSIFGQLKTLRITKRGKPFASQKEAQLASRKTETPIELPAGGFGVVDKAELEQVQASQVNQGSNETPGSDVGNGFKTGAYKGSKYRVSTTNSTGAENGTPILEKRMPSGSAATFYVGKDGNLLDADNVSLNDQSSKERVWRPASKEQTAEAASILDEMGKLDLNDPKRAELKVKLKALVLGEATSTIKPSMQAEASPIEQPSSNSAQQDRQDGKTEIAQNGMVIVHGSGNPGMSEQDIQIVRASGQKQGKKGRVYGGFYGTSEQDAHQAQAYADMMGGTPTLYDVKIKPGTKVLHKQGDITRLSESYINELVSQGYGVVTGTDPRGQTEHVVIDKSAVASMAPRGAQATPSQVNDTNVADMRQPSDQPTKNVSADTVPAPSAQAGEASQLAPAIDTGYREVIPVKQPKTEVSNEPVTPVPAISSEGQRDQPGAGEPVLPVAEPSTGDGAGLPAADNAGSAAPDAASMESQQDDQALNWSEPKSAEDYRKAQGRLFAGDMSYAEFKAMSRAMLDNAGALRAELEQKTKAELLQMMSAFNAARYKNEKKAAVVEAAYNQLLGDLRWAANGSSNTISETYALGGKRQSIEERVSSALDGLTEARYQQFIDKQHADMAELDRRRAALKQALTDPQTLEDFRAFVERRGSDKLTTEQRARYEDLVAASNMDKREAARDAKAETKVTATAAGDIIQTKHSKTGEDLFVVQMGDRVDRDTYNTVNAKAKEMGGWYSSFRGKGAVPGFQFKDKAKAAEFKGWLAGETATQAKPDAAPTEITEPSNDGGKGKQVETLRQRADSVRAKAEAALNAERKENTAKRAGQAAHARANAERDLRFADLLDAIATGIEAGEITYLRNLANGAQLEELQSALNRGLWNLPSAKVDELVSQGVIERDNNSRYSWSDKATPEQQVEGVTMPGMDYYTDRLRDAAFKMQSASGFKQAGVKIMILVKAAINRDSKRVTLSDPELIAKLKAFVNGSDDFSTSTIKDQIAGYSRLERMGITNQTELRAALRELVRLQKGLDKRAPQSDPLAEKTRNLKLRLLNNRNAFIDFFPTPEEHAADLVARAGIEPGMKVLEPSAGHGMLADAARAAGASVDAVELASDLRDILQTKGYPLVGADFMATEAKGDYDAVIMNPPFSNDMDIDHVRHAYDHLKPGGRLVAIVSAMAGERSNRKNKAFSEWLESLGAEQDMMPEGAFKDSLNPTSVRTKIITIEKPSDAVQGPTIKAGSRTTLHTPKGKPVEVQYRLMEAGDLVASHEFDGTVNRAYPQEMQPRDRSKGTYQVQVRQIANNPEGQRLGASPETDRGAPIVRDGVVESGNGRTIGLKQAYRQGSADNYRAWLVAHAADFGLNPDEVAAMSQPVLVRERLTEMDASERRDFVVDSNTDAKMANSASEDAKADAGRLDDRLLGMLNIPEGGNLLALSNEPFLNAFARAIGENSLNQYKDDKGRWNDAYQRRVANAIFAYGYDSDSLLKAATGDSDSAGKNLTSAMMNNAAKVAELRAAMPDHAQDLVALLTEAVETMNSARRNGQSIAEVVSQGDMMSGGVSHAGGALAEMLADASRSAKRLTETVGAILDMLNESASHAGQVDMLTGEQARTITAEEAINAQAREYRLRKEREQAAPRSSGDLFWGRGTTE